MQNSEWKSFRLSDLVLEQNQGVNTTTEHVQYSTGGIPVIKAGNIEDYRVSWNNLNYVDPDTFARLSENWKPKKDDVLFTNIGSQFGSAAVVRNPTEFLIAWNVLRIRVRKDRLAPDFLVYLLNEPNNKSRIKSRNSSSTMPFVSGKELSKLDFLIPPVYEQQAITRVLGTLDDKIELNRRINETLETIARAIFKSWFVDFDPVRAKAEGRDPGLPKQIVDLFPNSFEDSELGEIPAGWPISSLGELVKLRGGLSYKAEFMSNNGRPLVTMGCVSGTQRFNIDGLKFYKGEFAEQHILRSDDLVIATRDVTQNRVLLGSPAMIPRRLGKETAIVATNLYKVINDSDLPNHFLYFLMRSEAYREQIIASAKGTTVLMLTKDAVESFRFAKPPTIISTKFSALCEALYEKMSQTSIENELLIKLRDLLLPKLIAGELRLPKSINEAENQA